MNISKTLPCPVDKTEDELLEHILNMNKDEMVRKSIAFKQTYVPHAGEASKEVVKEIIRRLKE